MRLTVLELFCLQTYIHVPQSKKSSNVRRTEKAQNEKVKVLLEHSK